MADTHVQVISQDDLDAAGHPLPPGVDLPTEEEIPLQDDDAQQSRLVTWPEIQALYVDNPVDASPVQPDVWTLEIDSQSVTLTYSNGAQYSVVLGCIDWDNSVGADHYLQTGNIVFPVDQGGTVMLNKATAPHLVYMRTYLHEEVQKASQDRLDIAEIVNAFAHILSLNTAAGGVVGDTGESIATTPAAPVPGQ